MDEDEIMVGDHVSVWDGNPQSLQRCIEVKGILDGEVYYDIEDDEGKPVRVHDSVKHCHPIELREDDLERYGFGFLDVSNNWACQHGSVWHGWWIHKGLELGVCNMNKQGRWPVYFNVDDKNIKVEYLHQLQHIMKVCNKEFKEDNNG